MKPKYIDAVAVLINTTDIGGDVDGPYENLIINCVVKTPPTETQIQAKLAELLNSYNSQEYARKRQAEYPSIQELVVALYDTDDKSAIEAKREAVKTKYPKP